MSSVLQKPFASHEQQIKYIGDTSQNLLFMGLSCLTSLMTTLLKKKLSEYFGLSLGCAIYFSGRFALSKQMLLTFAKVLRLYFYFECKLSDHIIERISFDIILYLV